MIKMHVLEKLNNIGGFCMQDLYAWSDVWSNEYIGKRLIDMDENVLDMNLRDISNLLGEQYEKNVQDDIPVAALIMKGFNIHTGKRMCLHVLLCEDEEEE